MSLILLKISILMCGLCFRLHASSLDCNKQPYQRGSDVTLRCDVPLLSETSTLQWIKDSGQTSNTTLVYNNSAYIILHNVDEHSEGKYYCRIMQNSRVETVMNHTVCVTQYSESKKLVIYRQSSSYSDLLLICKSKKVYYSHMWVWETKTTKDVIISVKKGGQVQVNGTIKPGNKTSATFNSQIFILHLSPVEFNYNGTYKCIPNYNNSHHLYTTTTLHTIRVSAEPPGGVLMNESVVLTCEVSDVTDSVMLAWLRMHGDRGVLFKQRILNEKNLKKRLTVNVNSIQSDMQHWQCAVFTENKLKALAPITISLLSNYQGTSVRNIHFNISM
nr:uncharacterized protein LOC129452458 [Misgurnus anguillicaudatus]XP_055072295.1 uncharacterized protein LOC129452458 [Misgurnus anguillicaudatus]